jgi:FKBP12-rapamycin complex-associated protein
MILDIKKQTFQGLHPGWVHPAFAADGCFHLQVAARSASDNRRRNAEYVVSEIQSHSPNLVKQTKRVSGELIRIAILWHEQWHAALEEASRLYFGECDVEGMLAHLAPLHDKLSRAVENPDENETESEKFFKAVRQLFFYP